MVGNPPANAGDIDSILGKIPHTTGGGHRFNPWEDPTHHWQGTWIQSLGRAHTPLAEDMDSILGKSPHTTGN